MTGHIPTRGNTYYNTVGNLCSFARNGRQGWCPCRPCVLRQRLGDDDPVPHLVDLAAGVRDGSRTRVVEGHRCHGLAGGGLGHGSGEFPETCGGDRDRQAVGGVVQGKVEARHGTRARVAVMASAVAATAAWAATAAARAATAAAGATTAAWAVVMAVPTVIVPAAVVVVEAAEADGRGSGQGGVLGAARDGPGWGRSSDEG